MDPGDILTQRDWTEQELHEAGFRYYKRKPRVVLARKLPDEEAPLEIKYNDDTLIAIKGYVICFRAGWRKRKSLYDYHHWPLEPNHFVDLLTEFNDPNWKPKRGEKHLLSLGCNPYVNIAGVWAKKLTHPQLIQGVEHTAPFEVPKGAWLLLASKGSAKGAPYWVSDRGFKKNFDLLNKAT